MLKSAVRLAKKTVTSVKVGWKLVKMSDDARELKFRRGI